MITLNRNVEDKALINSLPYVLQQIYFEYVLLHFKVPKRGEQLKLCGFVFGGDGDDDFSYGKYLEVAFDGRVGAWVMMGGIGDFG